MRLLKRNAPKRFKALDSMRGVSALMVATFHAAFLSHVSNFALVRNGWLFVDFFFVLSGFIIAVTYAGAITDRRTLLRFVGLRLGRIYPLHVFVLLAYVAYEVLWWAVLQRYSPRPRPAFSGNFSLTGLVASLALVHSFGSVKHLVWNTPSWSIGAEFYTYLLFAFAALMLTQRRLWIAMVVAGLVAMYYCYADPPYVDQTYRGFGRCLSGFAIGSLISLWNFKPKLRNVATQSFVELAVIALVVLFITSTPPSFQWLAPLVFGIAVGVFAAEGGLVSRFLSEPVPCALGAISYSIYMIHLFTLQIVSNAATALHWKAPGSELIGLTRTQGDFGVVIYLGIVVGLATLSYRYIEAPFRRQSRAFLDRRLSKSTDEESQIGNREEVVDRQDSEAAW